MLDEKRYCRIWRRFGESAHLQSSLAEVLGMAEKIAVEHVHESIIVALDEFQEINSDLCDFGQCRVNFVSKMCVRPLISCQKCATLRGERYIIGEKRRRN